MIPLTCFNLITDGSSGSDKNNSELEPKGKLIPRREAQPRATQSTPLTAFAPSNV